MYNMEEHIQFLDLNNIPSEVKNKIMALNKDIGKRAIQICTEEDEDCNQNMINIDVEMCNGIAYKIRDKIKKILDDAGINFIISGASG